MVDMRYRASIHNKAMLAKSLLGHVQKLAGDLHYPPEELIVVNYHSTPKKFIPNFRRQLDFFRTHFDIMDPVQLENYYRGAQMSGRCKLLITFDDGLRNNLYAASVLRELDIKAFYFVVPAFIETAKENQKQYYVQHIRPVINSEIDSDKEDFEAMSWEEISELVSAGNRIGSHTYTHTMVANDLPEIKTREEIAGSKHYLEEKLGKNIDAFCSINNTLLSIGPKEKELIRASYKFHFTTLPGMNAMQKDPLFIKRRNVECYWLDGSVYFALGKIDLKRWSERVKKYAAL